MRFHFGPHIRLGVLGGLVLALAIVLIVMFALNWSMGQIEEITGMEISEWSVPASFNWSNSEINARFRMKDEAGLALAEGLTDNGFIWEGDWLVSRVVESYTYVGFRFNDLESDKTQIVFYAEK